MALQGIEKKLYFIIFLIIIGFGSEQIFDLLAAKTFKTCLENVEYLYIISPSFPAVRTCSNFDTKILTVYLETCSEVIINTLFTLLDLILLDFFVNLRHT